MNINKNRIARFGKTLIGEDNPVFIIGEIGTSHDGDLKKGEELIIAAREAGVDCVKFQYVIAEEIIHPDTGTVSLPGGEIALYERFLRLEKDPDFYLELKRVAEKNNLIFLCTPFGTGSAENLKNIGVRGFKIASPELNHYPLLESIEEYPVILSSGVSTLGDIEKAIARTSENTVLLHCITSYPAPEEEYNLGVIPSLSAIFGLPTGVSDHSKDPILVPVITTALGGSVIEKHMTLSRKGNGLDDPIALVPDELKTMCSEVRAAEKRSPEETFSFLYDTYGRSRIDTITGSGIKKLAPSETGNYRTTNRSIMATADIKKGELFTENNIALLRSEKQLSPGLGPELYTQILKRSAADQISSGTGITWDCF